FLHAGVGGGGVELVAHLVEGDQRRAGIFPIDVDLAGLLRLAQRRRAKADALVDAHALGLEIERRYLGHDLLLGEVLTAHHDRLLGSGRERHADRHRRRSRQEVSTQHRLPPLLSKTQRNGLTPRGISQCWPAATSASTSTASSAVDSAPASS